MGTIEKQQTIKNMCPADQNAADEFLKDMAIDVLARTIYGEARSETLEGMKAVAHVVLNRVAKAKKNNGKYWWGHDVITVCQKPYQFSCWNPGDPNRKKLMSVGRKSSSFRKCIEVATLAVNGDLGKDITNGADHYHTTAVAPKWSLGRKPISQFGTHVFFKLEG